MPSAGRGATAFPVLTKVWTPRKIRYPAPRSLTNWNASAERLRITESPAEEAMACTRQPRQMPSVVNIAAVRPRVRAFLVTKAMSAPGAFEFHDGKTIFRREDGSSLEMKPETKLTVGARTFSVIERAGSYGVRLRDNHSKLREEFRGQRWFPVSESYRVTARFVSYDKPKPIAVPNVLGSSYQETTPGYAVFNLHGKKLRLEPVLEGKTLFFI